VNGVFLGLALFIGALVAVNLYRVASGPTLYDRLVAVNMIGTKSILLLGVAGILFEREAAFVDLAIVYAMLSFVGVIAIAKYLERRPGVNR
jgi:multicomponent Na+:H+ antiporter subunit F